jgi:acyl-coenzyme A synthetase/AMP-(fatty) acid ligase
MAKTIGEILCEQARVRPDAVALVDSRARRGRPVSFAGLEQAVAVAAEWLHARGLRKGNAVLVFVPMSAELYVALLAMFRLGVVALFLDPSAGRLHIEQCCARWAPDALLAIPRAHLLRVRSAALRRIPLKIVTSGWLPGATRWLAGSGPVKAARLASDTDGGQSMGGLAADSSEGIEPGDAALVTFTSGSTGVPKAAVRTHGLAHSAWGAASVAGVAHSD